MVKVRFLYGDQQSLEKEINENDTIINIKASISNEIQIDSIIQKWVYKGRFLTDSETLISYNFSDGDSIHIIKSAAKQSQPGASSTSSSTASTPASTTTPRQTTYHAVPQFDQAMGNYLNLNSNEEDVKNCLSTIAKILSNIIEHPFEEKYRNLKSTNQHFQKKVGSQPGANNLLQALGFILQGETWILTPNPQTWDNIVSCHQKIQKFLEKLKSSSSAQSTSPSSPSSSSSQVPESTASFSSSSAPPLAVPSSPSNAAPSAPLSIPSLDPQTFLALQSLASLLSLQDGSLSQSVQPSTSSSSTTNEHDDENKPPSQS